MNTYRANREERRKARQKLVDDMRSQSPGKDESEAIKASQVEEEYNK